MDDQVKAASYGSSPGRGLSPTSSSSAQPEALLIPELKAGIYLGESASESKGRPRPLWRETIIRAGRGGGYGSSSVSSVRGTCRAGGRPAEKTNRCFFFLLLLLLPHRNTHKHPTGGPSYRGGIAAGPGTNPPVGGGVPPCGLVVSEQNADRKCSCRNDSLRRRQTLTTTPSSPLHFRHRRAAAATSARVFGCATAHGQLRSAPHPGPGGGRQRGVGGSSLRPSPQGGCGCCLLVSILRSGVFAAARAGRVFPVFIFLEADRSAARVRWWSRAWGALRPGPSRSPRTPPQLLVFSSREPSSGRPRRGRPRSDGDRAFFKWCPCSRVDGCIVLYTFLSF
ncbi:uncharacterized protein LOC118892052 [Balaenoptera musculus]|uniref:Uncharacterized protein LOC118892052 n=1 Tax=Balaenoptera musculus TaxID=9771 RepID=A0A8B8WXD4_BALMU|nr:uncharacterized protein LOC118892052 [Balaenoptera musculus]